MMEAIFICSIIRPIVFILLISFCLFYDLFNMSRSKKVTMIAIGMMCLLVIGFVVGHT